MAEGQLGLGHNEQHARCRPRPQRPLDRWWVQQPAVQVRSAGPVPLLVMKLTHPAPGHPVTAAGDRQCRLGCCRRQRGSVVAANAARSGRPTATHRRRWLWHKPLPRTASCKTPRRSVRCRRSGQRHRKQDVRPELRPDGARSRSSSPGAGRRQLPVPAAVQARSRTHLSTIEGVCEPARPRQRLPGVLNLQVAVDLRGGGYRGVAEQLAHHLHGVPARSRPVA